MADKAAISKVSAETAQRSVLIKLVIFSVSLAVVPISVFFISQSYIWNGNATYAAITAVFAANAVLVAYIVSSVLEDRETLNTSERNKLAESRKEQ